MKELKFRAYQKTPSLNHKPGLYEVTGLDFYEGDYGGGEVCLRNKKGEQWTEYIKDVVLEQYAGLTDKNGKEIYEGDIVGTYEYYYNEETGEDEPGELEPWGVIVYEAPSFGLWGEPIYGGEDKHFFEATNGMAVVGNIHENKELLDGSN